MPDPTPAPTPTPADVAEAERLFNEKVTLYYGEGDTVAHGDFIAIVAALLARARAAEDRAKTLEYGLRLIEDSDLAHVHDAGTLRQMASQALASLPAQQKPPTHREPGTGPLI